MQQDAVVRDATGDDAQAISDIGAIGFPRAHEGVLPAAVIDAIVTQTYAPDAVRRSVAAAADDEGAHFLVAVRDGRVVGFADYDERGEEPELHRIYVAPDAAGSGVGSALLDELHRRLPAGTSYILMVAAANRPAIGFYERHRFVLHDTVDGIGFYRTHMDVAFPPDAREVPALVLRYTTAAH